MLVYISTIYFISSIQTIYINYYSIQQNYFIYKNIKSHSINQYKIMHIDLKKQLFLKKSYS